MSSSILLAERGLRSLGNEEWKYVNDQMLALLEVAKRNLSTASLQDIMQPEFHSLRARIRHCCSAAFVDVERAEKAFELMFRNFYYDVLQRIRSEAVSDEEKAWGYMLIGVFTGEMVRIGAKFGHLGALVSLYLGDLRRYAFQLRERERDRQLAILHYRQAIALNPSSGVAYNEVACLLKERDPVRGLLFLLMAHSASNPFTDAYTNILSLLGKVMDSGTVDATLVLVYHCLSSFSRLDFEECVLKWLDELRFLIDAKDVSRLNLAIAICAQTTLLLANKKKENEVRAMLEALMHAANTIISETEEWRGCEGVARRRKCASDEEEEGNEEERENSAERKEETASRDSEERTRKEGSNEAGGESGRPQGTEIEGEEVEGKEGARRRDEAVKKDGPNLKGKTQSSTEEEQLGKGSADSNQKESTSGNKRIPVIGFSARSGSPVGSSSNSTDGVEVLELEDSDEEADVSVESSSDNPSKSTLHQQLKSVETALLQVLIVAGPLVNANRAPSAPKVQYEMVASRVVELLNMDSWLLRMLTAKSDGAKSRYGMWLLAGPEQWMLLPQLATECAAIENTRVVFSQYFRLSRGASVEVMKNLKNMAKLRLKHETKEESAKASLPVYVVASEEVLLRRLWVVKEIIAKGGVVIAVASGTLRSLDKLKKENSRAREALRLIEQGVSNGSLRIPKCDDAMECARLLAEQNASGSALVASVLALAPPPPPSPSITNGVSVEGAEKFLARLTESSRTGPPF